MDLHRTPPAAKVEDHDVARELEATRELAMQANNDSTFTKPKQHQNITKLTDKNVNPNQPSHGEWPNEALDTAVPEK